RNSRKAACCRPCKPQQLNHRLRPPRSRLCSLLALSRSKICAFLASFASTFSFWCFIAKANTSATCSLDSPLNGSCRRSKRFLCSFAVSCSSLALRRSCALTAAFAAIGWRSEEHTSELQSRFDLVCRLLLEKKK